MNWKVLADGEQALQDGCRWREGSAWAGASLRRRGLLPLSTPPRPRTTGHHLQSWFGPEALETLGLGSTGL